MRVLAIAFRLLSILAFIAGGTLPLRAQQRYSQIVLPFPEERPYSYRFEPADRALVLEIQKTHPDELEALFNYDETIVRRAFFKDLGGQATEVRLILRDDLIKVMIQSFQEPFRITLDFFDADYKEAADPMTGLPLTPLASSPTSQEVTHGEAPSALASAPLPEQSSDKNGRASGKRRLLQNEPKSIRTAQELVLNLNDTAGGIGQNWKIFPPYIYRIQTASVKTGKNYSEWMKQNAGKALSSSETLATYASQLFDFGHENRALLAYQKILHEDPSVFDRHAEHIWKLAEIHLGQGSLTLADGYYDSLTAKHPDHPLAEYAKLRRLDIKAIRASQEQKVEQISLLGPALDTLQLRENPALASQVALRRAYWQIDAAAARKLLPRYEELPNVGPNVSARLEEARGGSDSPRTAFLIDAILLQQKLRNSAWNPETAEFAAAFFDRYKGKATSPYRDQLLLASEQSILKVIQKHLKSEQYPEVVAIVESLPKALEELRKSSELSWAAAESYRRLQQPSAALPYYQAAAKSAKSKPDQFRTYFWLSQSAMAALDNERTKKSAPDVISSLQKTLSAADQNSWNSWKALTPDEKSILFAETKEVIEQNVQSSHFTKTSPRILLEVWSQRLATDTPSAGGGINKAPSDSQPNSRLIRTLADLSRRFEQLGMDPERRAAKLLQRRINVKSLTTDKDAISIWTKELTQLAEELRKTNDYLEAGRLYALTGSENNQWDGRAEALYKGGLLLYRSGRREEALAAFQAAANDGNNLLYAELAKKRLEQLQQ